jgi:hypothetical protein
MKSVFAGFLLLAIAVSGATTAVAAQDQADNNGRILRLHVIKVYDNQGWGQPVLAYTMLVPDGWRVEGGIQWHSQWHCLSTDAITNQLRVTSPDGRYAFEAFPDYGASWYDDAYKVQTHQQQLAMGQQVCPLARPFNASGFLTGIFVPAFRRGAQIESVQQNRQAAQALYDQITQSYGALLRATGGQVSTDAARVILREQGSEEVVMANTAVTATRGMSATAAANGQIAYSTDYTLGASKVVSFRAPVGQLQQMEPLFGAMLGSIHINPAWQAAITQFLTNMGNIQTRGAIDRANIMRDAQNQIGDTIMSTWQRRQDSLDRISRSWSQTIRGTGDFVDPATNTTVELPWGYDNVWSDGNGEYLLTTIQGFNPNSDLRTNQNWTQMQAAR